MADREALEATWQTNETELNHLRSLNVFRHRFRPASMPASRN
jgi:hypothetical protein